MDDRAIGTVPPQTNTLPAQCALELSAPDNARDIGIFSVGEHTTRQGERLDAWIAAVRADDQPDLHSFTAGLLRDHDAVRNGLTLPHSSGVVEGHVNRIKMIKRQMYGRANLDLLRKRVLLAT
jgi:transposase